jgi:hypothetical protein
LRISQISQAAEGARPFICPTILLASAPFFMAVLTKVNGRASRPEHRSADNGDTRKTRVQARINTDAGVKMH